MVQFAIFKRKERVDRGVAWELIEPCLETRCANEAEAGKIANALLSGYTLEVRWNWRGSYQGHYHSRVKDSTE